jgi:hypothetical protein
VAQGQFVSDHSNVAMHKYTGSAQLLEKGGKKEEQNANTLVTNILPKLKPQFVWNLS